MTRQIPLSLPVRVAYGREDFMVAPCNAEAVAWLDRWPDWPTPFLVVHGPAGSGKTHLAHVWQARSGAAVAAARDLRREDVPDLLKDRRAVLVDDAEACPQPDALLHLYNLCREESVFLLLTAARPPARWDLTLRDLASRLRTVPAVALTPPDEDFTATLLVKHLADRQLQIPPEVVSYVLPRLERSFGAARDFAAAVDRESLAERRPVTIPLARRVLARMREPLGG